MTGGKENSKSGSDRFEHEYYIFPIYTSSSSWILMSQYVWRIIAAAGREKQTQNLLLHHFHGNLPNYVWQIVKTYQKPCMQNSAVRSMTFFLLDLTNIFHIHEVFYWFTRWFFINNSIVILDIYLIIAIIRNENTSPTIWKKKYIYIDVGIEGIFCLFRLMNGQQIISGMH